MGILQAAAAAAAVLSPRDYRAYLMGILSGLQLGPFRSFAPSQTDGLPDCLSGRLLRGGRRVGLLFSPPPPL